ncbi:MAG TPA: hypothetical protein VHG28_10910 [Longimicrobiaceae bacterium]|nr:hypothetical protein [Longimicrobiaceae bacterium]
MYKAVSLTSAVFVLLAGTAGAQEAGSSVAPTVEAARVAAVEQTAARSLPVPAVFEAAPVATPPRVEALEARRARVRSATRSLLHTVGGAAVGAFVGYFASQVVKSDWDKKNDAEVSGHRTSYAFGGALAGSLGGLLIGMRSSSEGVVAVPVRAGDDKIIIQEQIEAAGLANVYDLVQALHPEWLRTRGVRGFYEGAGMLVGDEPVALGGPTIRVYLDDARMGGVEALRQIPTASVVAVRFLDPGQATYKWGIGHNHGAIWVTTAR